MVPKRSREKSKRVGGKDRVLTPGGWRLKSKTFEVQPGQHVAMQGGKLRVIDTATGAVVADLGAVDQKAAAKRGGRSRESAKRKK